MKVTVCVMTKHLMVSTLVDVQDLRDGVNGEKNVDLRGKKTELCVSAAKSCSHMTRNDSKMPLRKTFSLHSSAAAVPDSSHVSL